MDPQRQRRLAGASTVAVLAVTAGVLSAMGQAWWCRCGRAVPWSFDIWTSHNSQHLVDPYFLSHVLHGLLFFGALVPLAKLAAAKGVPAHFTGHPARFVAAMVLEAAWEIFENTPLVINRYRESTASLDYFGDSVLNSLSDIGACALGYGVALALPAWGSVAFFVALELVMVAWIRDSLVLNVIMLVWPIEAIKQWQMGG